MLKKAKTTYTKFQKQIHEILIFSIIIFWILWKVYLQSALEFETGVIITLCIFAVILNDVAHNTYRRNQTLYFRDQENMYNHILGEIRNTRIKSALFLQYSGRKVDSLLTETVRAGADVTLYIQRPSCAISNYQRDRINNYVSTLKSIDELTRLGNLQVYYYSFPGSFRAVSINSNMLAVGWYNYDKNEQNKDSGDHTVIHGHNSAGIVCYSGSKEFDILKAEMDRVEKRLIGNREHVPILS